MSTEDYKQAGYMLSANVAQAVIDKAEKDVLQAYIAPIDADADTTSEGIARDTLMELAYLACLQRSIFATRSGAKEKQTPQSNTATRWDVLSQQSAICAMRLRAFAEQAQVKDYRKRIVDICGIFFNTNYLAL